MSNHEALHHQIVKLFIKELQLDVPSPDADIVEAGILDSVAFVALLVSIEREFEINIPFDRIEVDNFRSVSRIAEFVGDQMAVKNGSFA